VSEDQKTKLAECKKAMGTLQKEVRAKMVSILTKEQKAQLKGVKKRRRKKEEAIARELFVAEKWIASPARQFFMAGKIGFRR
jgi:hypothetical protein